MHCCCMLQSEQGKADMEARIVQLEADKKEQDRVIQVWQAEGFEKGEHETKH